MFWDIFKNLCIENNTSPNGVAKTLGFSNAAATKWKSGSVPNATTVQKIADYFNVSVDYLLGKTDIKKDRLPPILSHNACYIVSFSCQFRFWK